MRIVGEVLLGGTSGAALSLLWGVAGAKITAPEDMNGLVGAVAGFLSGSIVGSSLGVYSVGNRGNQTGSYWATALGSTAGLASFGCLWLSGIVEADSPGFWIGLYAFPTLGAVTGFNVTRRYRTPLTPGEALVNLGDDRQLFFGIPVVSLRPNPLARGDLILTIDLVQLPL